VERVDRGAGRRKKSEVNGTDRGFAVSNPEDGIWQHAKTNHLVAARTLVMKHGP